MFISKLLTPTRLSALLLTVAAFPLPGLADTPPPPLQMQLAARQQQPPTLEQAVKRIKKNTGGRILTAETIKHKGRLVHRIKVLLPNGHVRVTFTNAE